MLGGEITVVAGWTLDGDGECRRPDAWA